MKRIMGIRKVALRAFEFTAIFAAWMLASWAFITFIGVLMALEPGR